MRWESDELRELGERGVGDWVEIVRHQARCGWRWWGVRG